MWHVEGGWTSILEDELIQARPQTDDIKDALASAVSIATPPARSMKDKLDGFMTSRQPINRFGGFR